MKDIHDVITHVKFGDERLRGSGVVAGQISAFPIDFAGRPYNTLTLPCERVILLLTTRFGARSLRYPRAFGALGLRYAPPPPSSSRRCYVADVTAAMTSALHSQ